MASKAYAVAELPCSMDSYLGRAGGEATNSAGLLKGIEPWQ